MPGVYIHREGATKRRPRGDHILVTPHGVTIVTRRAVVRLRAREYRRLGELIGDLIAFSAMLGLDDLWPRAARYLARAWWRSA